MPTRSELEQQALRFIQRGQAQKALDIYQFLLRQDTRDRRIRQKVGELYLKMGKPQEGARFLREAAEQAHKEGQPRAAIALYKVLRDLSADDCMLRLQLGDAYRSAEMVTEAERTYEETVRLAVQQKNLTVAIEAQRNLLEARPTDLNHRFRLAELLQSAGDEHRAVDTWLELAGEFERRGEPSEMARVLDAVLRLRPDNEAIRLRTAAARLQQGDPERALELVGNLASSPEAPPEALRVAAEAHRARAATGEARALFMRLAAWHRAQGDTLAQARTLDAALECGEDDPALRRMVQDAREVANRLQRRLTDEPVLAPASDAEVRHCVRAEVLWRYGFRDRAIAELEAASPALPESLAIPARLVEILIEGQSRAEALQLLQDVARRARGQARRVLSDRLQVLGGEPVPDETEEVRFLAPEDLLDDELIEDVDELDPASFHVVDDSAEQTNPDLEDDPDAELKALQEAYSRDPMNQELLLRLAEVRSRARGREAAPAEPVPREAPTPAGPTGPAAAAPAGGDELDFLSGFQGFSEEEPALGSDDDPVGEVLAMVSVGLDEQALEGCRKLQGLEARVVEARALANLGRRPEALGVLRTALSTASDDEPAYADALLDMADLMRLSGHPDRGLRLLEELVEIFPHFRRKDVQARLRGMRMLVGR